MEDAEDQSLQSRHINSRIQALTAQLLDFGCIAEGNETAGITGYGPTALLPSGHRGTVG
jgi:hypothetical protein